MKKINSKLFTIIELICLTIIGIGHCVSFTSLNIIVSLIIAIIMICANLENCTVMLITALPFFNILNTNMGTTSLYYIYVIIFIIKYFASKKKCISKTKILILLMIFIIRLSCSDFQHLIRWMLLFTAFVLTFQEDFFTKNIKRITNNISFSFLLSSILGYIMLLKGISLYTGSYVYSTIRFAGLVGDSVFYSQFGLVIVALNYILLYYKFNIKNTLYIILIYIFIILTYSKTGIILSLLLLFIYLFSIIIKNAKSRKKAIKSIILLGTIFITTFFSANYIINNTSNSIINNYIVRFSAKDLTTGRMDAAKHYIELLKDTPSTLIVAMDTEKYFAPFYPNERFIYTINRAHNVYIETLCTFGIIPSLFIFLWIIKNICMTLKRKDKLVLMMPVLIILATGLSLHGNFEFHYYILLTLSFSVFDKKIDRVLQEI